jgi:hypothetical protein
MKLKWLRTYGKPVVCVRCKRSGGTLVKTEDGQYRHQRIQDCLKSEVREENDGENQANL